MLTFTELSPLQTPLLNKFYKAHKYNRTASKKDKVWVVKSESSIVAGCYFRVVAKQLFLTGVFVSPEFRSQGVAKNLLRKSLSELKQPVVTFPFDSLTSFYSSLGFQTLTPDNLNSELVGRYNAYKKYNSTLGCMLYKPDFLK